MADDVFHDEGTAGGHMMIPPQPQYVEPPSLRCSLVQPPPPPKARWETKRPMWADTLYSHSPLKIFNLAKSQGRYLYACAPMVRYSKVCKFC